MKANEFLTEAGAVPIYYFAYGMLTDPKLMRGAEFVGTAVLRNFEYEMFQYANVYPQAGGQVIGVLWALDRNMLAGLDQTEGYPQLYDRKTVPVYIDGEKVVAELYTMTPETRQYLEGSKPNKTYVARIARGYQAAGVPMQQLTNSMKTIKNTEQSIAEADDDRDVEDDNNIKDPRKYTKDPILNYKGADPKIRDFLQRSHITNPGSVNDLQAAFGHMADVDKILNDLDTELERVEDRLNDGQRIMQQQNSRIKELARQIDVDNRRQDKINLPIMARSNIRPGPMQGYAKPTVPQESVKEEVANKFNVVSNGKVVGTYHIEDQAYAKQQELKQKDPSADVVVAPVFEGRMKDQLTTWQDAETMTNKQFKKAYDNRGKDQFYNNNVSKGLGVTKDGLNKDTGLPLTRHEIFKRKLEKKYPGLKTYGSIFDMPNDIPENKQ